MFTVDNCGHALPVEPRDVLAEHGAEALLAEAGRDAHRGATATVVKMAPRTPAAPGTMAPPATNGRAAAAASALARTDA